MKKRIRTFDIAKGIAIILVVFGHALQGIRDSQGVSATSAYSSIFYVCSIIYTFHMPLFFFVSGIFVASWSRRKFSVAVMQKVKTLVIPYFIWTIITGSFMQLASHYTNNGLGFKQVLLSWWVPFSEYWFLYVLFFTFLIYYLFVNFAKNGLVVLLVTAFVLYFLIPVTPKFWIVNFIEQYLIFFVLGSCLSKSILSAHEVLFSTRSLYMSSILFAILTIVWMFLFAANESATPAIYYKLLMAFSGIWMTLSISNGIDKSLTRVSHFFNQAGKDSMAIYVMHLLPLAGSRIVVIKLMHLTNLWVIVFLITIISLLTCYVFSWIINNLKLDQFFFGRTSLS